MGAEHLVETGTHTIGDRVVSVLMLKRGWNDPYIDAQMRARILRDAVNEVVAENEAPR